MTLSRNLLAWYRKEKRALPWRGTADPYAIWISEVMLQQTTVPTVAARYEPFLRRFPDVGALARAREESVLAAWSGLGYYARARNLRRAAREIVARHGSQIPSDFRALRRLPGFGDYTANALLALAFGRYTLPMDANLRRVASRLFATRDPETTLSRLVSRRKPADSIAALFDLGQLLCRPRSPSCPACPLRRQCRAYRSGDVGSFPPSAEKSAAKRLYLAVLIIDHGGRFFVRRRSSTWLNGMWEFPGFEAPSPGAARRELEKRFGPLPVKPCARVSHSVVNRRIRAEIYRAKLGRAAAALRAERATGAWMTPRRLERAAVSSLTRKICDAVPAPERA